MTPLPGPFASGELVILIAEDDPVIRNLVRISLQREGYFILAAGDGTEALTLSREFKGRIEMLLSDIQMPNMDGIALQKQINEERPGIK